MYSVMAAVEDVKKEIVKKVRNTVCPFDVCHLLARGKQTWMLPSNDIC